MINRFYKSKQGTEHVVRILGKYREMLRGETLENTAHTYQVLAQRQFATYYDGVNLTHKKDDSFDPFTMELELFLENYELLL